MLQEVHDEVESDGDAVTVHCLSGFLDLNDCFVAKLLSKDGPASSNRLLDSLDKPLCEGLVSLFMHNAEWLKSIGRQGTLMHNARHVDALLC